MFYIHVIQQAIYYFPIIALIFTLPYMIIQYHRYGSISKFRSLIIYSFILYLLVAYCLVILPLPSIEEVAKLTTERYQIIPFNIIKVIIENTTFQLSSPITYITCLKDFCIIQPLFNIFLTIPLGMYLRYYFQFDLKKTILYSFLLSLFFELTQLTGLYFIYPRSYRLFDVDDLLLNTLGGFIGYFTIMPLLQYLPTKASMDKHAIIEGKKVSGLRRTLSILMDMILYIMIMIFVASFMPFKHSTVILFIVYFILIPILTKGSTLMELFFHLKVVRKDTNTFSIIHLILRRLCFIVYYLFIPTMISYILIHLSSLIDIQKIFIYILIFTTIIALNYLYSICKILFTSKAMLYELLSSTTYISTIQ